MMVVRQQYILRSPQKDYARHKHRAVGLFGLLNCIPRRRLILNDLTQGILVLASKIALDSKSLIDPSL
ncbi:hypothetical protein ARMGADRAFT_1017652, partial [Armillaria gallica]